MTARKYIPGSILVLLAVAVGLLFVVPPEAKLGNAIRVVLLHGALARTGLTLFAVAAVVGAAALVTSRPTLFRWTWTAQRTVMLVWVINAIVSTIATWFTWGVAVAWTEPRTQASIKILVMALVFLPLALWIANERFTALLNVIAGISAVTLSRMAGLVQHPENPVMDAGTAIFPIVFLAVWLLMTLASLQAARWIHGPAESAPNAS